MNATKEQRFVIGRLSVRDSQGDEGAIVGYAAKFNSLSSDLGGFKERLKPGCFSRSLQSDRDVKMFLSHDASRILGRKANGTLSLAEDSNGLNFRCRLPNTQDGRDVREMVRSGLMNECSFGFQIDDPDDQFWEEDGTDDDGERCLIRNIKNLRLWEISLVSQPAYEHGTSATLATNSKATSVYSSHEAVAVRHSFAQLWPTGLPQEIRAHVGDVRALAEKQQERRRRLANTILSI